MVPAYRLRPLLALLLAAVMARSALALDPHVPLRQDGAQVWQTESGLPQNTVHAILQSHDGFLWVATEGGLVRFDGEKFVTYTSEKYPQIPSDVVYGLMQDRAGTLWISTSGCTNPERSVKSFTQGQHNVARESLRSGERGEMSVSIAT